MEANLNGRRLEAERGEGFVLGAVQGFSAWRRGLAAGPAISSLRARAEEIRRAELGRLEGQWDDLSPADRERLEGLTKGIVNKLLHEPTVRMRAAADRRGRPPAPGEPAPPLRPRGSRPVPDRLRRGDAVRLILATRRSPLALAQTELVAAAPPRRGARDRAAAAHHDRRPLERRGHRRGSRQGPLREGARGGAARRARPPGGPLGQGPAGRAARRAWPCSRCRRARIRATFWWARRGASPRCRTGARVATGQPAPRRPGPGGPPRPRRRADPGKRGDPARQARARATPRPWCSPPRACGGWACAPEGAEPLSVELSTPAPGQGLLAVEGRGGRRRRGPGPSSVLDDAPAARLPAGRARVPLGRGRGLPAARSGPSASPRRRRPAPDGLRGLRRTGARRAGGASRPGRRSRGPRARGRGRAVARCAA